MTYAQALSYIHSLLKFGIKPGLQRIEALLDRLGRPDRRLAVLHVAGTNGKGSTCAMLASILQAAGYKTGLFISPYVVNFRERMQINGQYIPPGELTRRTERLQKLAEELEKEDLGPTEFEFITALALEWFADEDCQAVVLETGLGGRLDSTNVVEKPLVSVITSISLDHTAILGDTIEKIAFEKSGIIKPGCPVVVSPGLRADAFGAIRRTAAEQNCSLYQPKPAREATSLGLEGSRFTAGGLRRIQPDGTETDVNDGAGQAYTVCLAGAHQVSNALTAIEAVRLCGLPVSQQAIETGLSAARFPARLELLRKQPPVVLDGAHNPEGAAALADAMAGEAGKITAIMGMMADKDYPTALSILAPLCRSIVTLRVRDNPRSLSAAALAAAARPYCSDVTAASSYRQALLLAREKAAGGPVLICGSFYLAGALRQKALDFFTETQK